MQNRFKKVLIILGVFSILAGGFAYWVYNYYFVLPTDPIEEDTEVISKEELQEQEKSEIAEKLGKYTVLVLGVDTSKSYRTRTDTMIVATIDSEKRKAQMISIPRDSRVKVKGDWMKINAAYVYGGADLAKDTVSKLLGVNIDRYVIVNFNSLIHLVDAVGGIEVDVPVRMYKPTEGINLQKGKQVLDGKKALAYSRFRGTAEGDLGRAKRQQEVITLLAKKVIGVDGIKNLSKLMDILMENVQTDIPRREIGALAKLAPDIMNNKITSVVVPGSSKRIDGLWYYIPDIKELEKKLTDEGI